MSTLTDHDLDNLRPNGRGRQIRFRADPTEDTAFRRAARLSGITLSAWVRIALREAAERRLANAGEKVEWL